MATTRFKGESGSDRLGVSTISDSDMIQVRHKPGTVDDADKGVSKAVLNSCPFGVSSTAAATAAKTAALTDSNPDFTLISGREVVVCFSAANSASSPTLNFAGSGAYPMYYPDGTAIGNWDAGTWMHLKYFEATINDTLTQRWIALSPVVTNAITSGDKRPAASGAVYSNIFSKDRMLAKPSGQYYSRVKINLDISAYAYITTVVALMTRGGGICIVAISQQDSGTTPNVVKLLSNTGAYTGTTFYYRSVNSMTEIEFFWKGNSFTNKDSITILTNKEHSSIQVEDPTTSLPGDAVQL